MNPQESINSPPRDYDPQTDAFFEAPMTTQPPEVSQTQALEKGKGRANDNALPGINPRPRTRSITQKESVVLEDATTKTGPSKKKKTKSQAKKGKKNAGAADNSRSVSEASVGQRTIPALSAMAQPPVISPDPSRSVSETSRTLPASVEQTQMVPNNPNITHSRSVSGNSVLQHSPPFPHHQSADVPGHPIALEPPVPEQVQQVNRIGNVAELHGSPEHIESQSERSNLSASAFDLTHGQQHNWISQAPSFTSHVSRHGSASNWQTNASEAMMMHRREAIQRETDALRISRTHHDIEDHSSGFVSTQVPEVLEQQMLWRDNSRVELMRDGSDELQQTGLMLVGNWGEVASSSWIQSQLVPTIGVSQLQAPIKLSSSASPDMPKGRSDGAFPEQMASSSREVLVGSWQESRFEAPNQLNLNDEMARINAQATERLINLDQARRGSQRARSHTPGRIAPRGRIPPDLQRHRRMQSMPNPHFPAPQKRPLDDMGHERGFGYEDIGNERGISGYAMKRRHVDFSGDLAGAASKLSSPVAHRTNRAIARARAESSNLVHKDPSQLQTQEEDPTSTALTDSSHRIGPQPLATAANNPSNIPLPFSPPQASFRRYPAEIPLPYSLPQQHAQVTPTSIPLHFSPPQQRPQVSPTNIPLRFSPPQPPLQEGVQTTRGTIMYPPQAQPSYNTSNIGYPPTGTSAITQSEQQLTGQISAQQSPQNAARPDSNVVRRNEADDDMDEIPMAGPSSRPYDPEPEAQGDENMMDEQEGDPNLDEPADDQNAAEEEEDYLTESRDRREQGLRAKDSKRAKRISARERMMELNEQLPPETQTMRRVVHNHAKFLLGIQQRNLTGLPPPPTTEERDLVVQRSKGNAFEQAMPTAQASAENHSRAFSSLVQTRIRELGLTRFTFDWMSSWKQPFNQVMDAIFFRTLDVALQMGEYSNHPWSPEHATHAIVSALLEKYFLHLQTEYKLIHRTGGMTVEERNRKQRLRKKRERLAQRRQQWCDESGFPELAAQFKDPGVCSDTEEIVEDGVMVLYKTRVEWRSQEASRLMEYIDHQILVAGRIGKKRRQPKFEERKPAIHNEVDPLYPDKISSQFYDANWVRQLQPIVRDKLKLKEIKLLDNLGHPLKLN